MHLKEKQKEDAICRKPLKLLNARWSHLKRKKGHCCVAFFRLHLVLCGYQMLWDQKYCKTKGRIFCQIIFFFDLQLLHRSTFLCFQSHRSTPLWGLPCTAECAATPAPVQHHLYCRIIKFVLHHNYSNLPILMCRSKINAGNCLCCSLTNCFCVSGYIGHLI